MIHHEQQGGPHYGDQQAVEVESDHTSHPESIEKPAPDYRADDAEEDVHHDTLAGPADELAGDEASDKAEDDLGQ